MVESNLDITLRSALSEVQKEKNVESLKFFCGQLESFDMFFESKGLQEKKSLKAWCIKAGQVLNNIKGLKRDPNMLRIYQIVAKLSENMRETGIYDQLEATGYFTDCLKFHVLWAESWAKAKNVQKFREVIELARNRIKNIPVSEVEDSFRDFARVYFPKESHIFMTDQHDEDTALIFATKQKPNRRRSSVAFIQQKAFGKMEVKAPESVSTFPSGGKTKIRMCFIDRDDYVGVSPEEFREALMKDRVDMDDDMDITHCVPIEPSIYTVSSDSATSSQTKLNERKKVFGMSCVSEESEPSVSHEDKRRRMYSPQKTNSASMMQRTSDTISSTRSSVPSSVHIATPALKEPSPPKPVETYGDRSYVDNFSKAAALFSETVNLDRPPLEDQTMPLENDHVEKFEVYIDETVHPSQSQNSPTCDNNRAPLQPVIPPQDIMEHIKERKPIPSVFKITEEDLEDLENFEIRRPPAPVFDDEITVAGFRSHGLESGQGIVTSTPAHFMNRAPTHEDFFSVKTDDEMEDDEDEDNDAGALGFMKRRNSLAPKAALSTVTEVPKTKIPIGVPSNSMNMALENLNLKGDELNETGVGRPTETISGEVNPWDSAVRQTIMDNGHYITPIEQHDYTTSCTKVQKNKVMVLGGERFQVLDMVGEGGFAKVFRCVNEEKQTLAMKYEVPSCSWEVYICEQVNRRLRQNGGPFARDVEEYSTMKITDAYIFSNASVLLNEFHSYGTLLDLTNKMKDPSWMIILLISINIARILREVHNVEIIHGDAKPDNFMILGPLPDMDNVDDILQHSMLKLIDWGRAIDMKYMNGTTFVGRGGTDKFDCPEMLDGRPWTYQTDFFNFVSTVSVVALGKYVGVRKGRSGRYEMQETMKRRLIIRDLMTEIFDRFINIRACDKLPNWDSEIELMTTMFRKQFNIIEWRNSCTKFNQSLPSP
ncbi:unnamed protein product [Auanema sp. JU1783]|nr:unnamed protein product [Auanema sp. JU1783]